LRLQGTWTDGRTDGQGDSYIPPPNFVCGGYNYDLIILIHQRQLTNIIGTDDQIISLFLKKLIP